jgi:hypothetical protein
MVSKKEILITPKKRIKTRSVMLMVIERGLMGKKDLGNFFIILSPGRHQGELG